MCGLYQWTCTGGSVLSMHDDEPQIHFAGKLPGAGRLLLKSTRGPPVAADAAPANEASPAPDSGTATAAL